MAAVTVDACPICEAPDAQAFLRRENVPVHQNLPMATAAEALGAVCGTLEMAVCHRCGFVFNRAFDPTLLAYGIHYDNTQSHSAMFARYMDELVEELVCGRGVRGSTVVEVGCGKGEFLERLISFPGAQNVGYGFDPSYSGPAERLGGALHFRSEYYGAEAASLHADVVVCRHVIEHVPRPMALIEAVGRALSGSPSARVFFETPCVDWLLVNQVNFDFFYEHCSLFSAFSLAYSFELGGFRTSNLRHAFGGQYLWIEAVPDVRLEPSPKPGNTPELARAFASKERELRQRTVTRLRELKRAGALAVWGAGAKGATFVNLFDRDRELIDIVIDLNPNKQGKFIPGTAHQIASEEALQRLGIRNVVLMNPNYRDEVRALLRHVEADVDIVELN